MRDFVCKTPAKFLENRKIQIEYLKKYAELAKISWQEYELTYINTGISILSIYQRGIQLH